MPTRPISLLATLAIMLAGLAGIAPASAATPVLWLCHPDLPDNPCEIPLDTTMQRADGTATVVTPKRPPSAKRPVDCFFVYPTISNDLTPYASRSRSPEVVSIAKYQAARFSQHCRMFAPVYRQSTMANLVLGLIGLPRERGPGYADVLTAWRDYLAHDNHGRGVVLIGHSQGSFVLRQLIAEEIEPHRQVRELLVGAVLLGGNVEVPKAKLVGGDFDRIPLCSKRGQAGCVVAYSSFASDPGSSATFGNSRDLKPGLEVACTDPTRLAGRAGQEFGIVQPSEPFALGLFRLALIATYGGDVPSASTTWVGPPDRYTGACARINGDHVFRYRPTTGSHRPAEFPPTWGTHTLDVNLGLGNLTRIVRLQTRTWLQAH
jgi:pimeloyl-ACP methyl ester carboxylesterase